MFPTPVSGLPELLFNEGYRTFKSFYQRTVMTDTTTNLNIIPYDDKELSAFEDTDDAINMLFMLHESILFKDVKGTTSEVTYLGSQLLDEVLLHKVRNKNGHKFLVDGKLLSSMDTTDISTVAVSISQYAAELPKLTRNQLEQISNPRILDDDQHQLMGLHCKLNNLSFPAMITLAKKGKLNKKFVRLKHRLPVCMSCMFGTCHCKTWHSKVLKGLIRKETDDAPGKCVSMDQMVSAQPGLIPQMAGFLTNLRIWGASIFVDHYSDYVFVALMCDLTMYETLLAKSSFERHANKGGVSIISYCVDNGQFADTRFQQAIKDSNQKITYCAVGYHYQNGIIERQIKKRALISRTLLLHAKQHWPKYINNDVAFCTQRSSILSQLVISTLRWPKL
jgi:hypothetical protein